ncbi:MAG TPA: hypothetical protein VN621_03020, partial [Arthrobacter sp.]|nr:hypothetical protein [Arthrobacter sp.]
MFDTSTVPEPAPVASVPAGPGAAVGSAAMDPAPSASPAVPGGRDVGALEVLGGVLSVVPGVDVGDLDEAQLVDALALAESAKNALAGFQARAAVALDAVVRERHRGAGVPGAKVGAGVHAQVALARAESPNTGHRL